MNNNNQGSIAGMPKNGIGVSIQNVLNESMDTNSELLKDNILLKAYIKQLEARVKELEDAADGETNKEE